MPKPQHITLHNLRRLLLVCLLSASCVSISFAAQQPTRYDKPKRLFIINSYNESAPWTQRLITPILAEASKRNDVACSVQHINTTYIRNDSVYQQMEDAIFQRYNKWQPNMVVFLGNNAFTIRDRVKEEWGDIPMLLVAEVDSVSLDKSYYYSGKPVESYYQQLTPTVTLRKDYNFTYFGIPCYVERTIDMMVQMVPDMKKLVFAADDMYNNQRYERIIRDYLKEAYPELQYIRIVASEDGEEELKEYLLSPAGQESAVLFSTWFYQKKTLYGFNTLISGDYRILTYSPRPVFCLRSAYLNENGFLGGYYYDVAEMQSNLRTCINKLMDGEDMRRLEFVQPDIHGPYIDYSQLMRDSVNIKQCPEETVFINRPPTFWEQYLWYGVMFAIIITLVVVVFIVIIATQVRRNRFLAIHSNLLRNMPIFYTKGKVTLDKNGNAQSITYTEGNYASQQLFADNSVEKGKNSLFEVRYILKFAEMALKEQHIVSFTHYFKETGSFYEFAVCPSNEKNAIDIFGMNVTARHEAEMKLRETNQKLELTLSVAKIIPWTWDLQTNMITCEEQRILNTLKFNHQPDNQGFTIMKSSEYFQRIHKDDQPRLKQVFKSVLCGETENIRTEYRVVSQVNGRQRIDWVEVNAIVERKDDDIRPHKITGSLLLITERKRQEQRLIEARNKAAESDKLKSAFLANVSHEIRTPLNAIIGFSNLLTTAETTEERNEYISFIENNNDLLLQLISDILDLSKIESNTFDINESTVDLNDVMVSVENTVKNRIKPTVRLCYQQGAEECYTITDRNRVSQILINLLNNAAKFTSVGEITFGYEIREAEGEIYFFVKDTGIGIAPEDKKRIFERFVKVNSFVQGTGLGLSICQSVVTQMKGKIGVESDGPGNGSLFWFTLPYKPTKPTFVKLSNKNDSKREEIYDKIKILVAEDNADNFHLLASLLDKKYNVIHAWDGQECIDLFKQENPHIILMDINMPNIDGYEATKVIRSINNTVPIIAVTAYAYDSDKERILRSGFNDYISKPLNPNKLNETVLNMVNRNFVFLM